MERVGVRLHQKKLTLQEEGGVQCWSEMVLGVLRLHGHRGTVSHSAALFGTPRMGLAVLFLSSPLPGWR